MELHLMNTYCTAAVEAAESAASLIDSYQKSGAWTVSHKSDDSPVTEVDIAAEEEIRRVLLAADSSVAFYGEETGQSGSSNRTWLVDPIDGTKSFVRGMRYFSTQIALQEDGELVLGVSNAPAYGEQLVASRGQGATLNGVACQTRTNIALSQVYLSTGNLTSLAHDSHKWQRLAELIKQVHRVRGYGDFCHYHQLCCGQADVVLESDVNILDIAALSVAVVEAGGVITDMDGEAINLDTRSVLAAANPQLHSTVLKLLNG